MAAELRHPRRGVEDPIHDEIVVAADPVGSVSSGDVRSLHRQAASYPDLTDHEEFSGHPTPAKGPNLAITVADTASRSAPEPVTDKPGKPVELCTRQQGRRQPRRDLEDPDGSLGVSGKGKGRVTATPEGQAAEKKAKTPQRTPKRTPQRTPQRKYCARCQERKSKPAVTGRMRNGRIRNGNAVHKCGDCKALREKASEQAERSPSKEKARQPAQPAQPEGQGASTTGKGRPRPPKQNSGPASKPVSGKREYVALPSKVHQEQDDGSEFDTESDDPNNPCLPNSRTPNVDRFGITTGRVNTNHQILGGLRQQDSPPEAMVAVPKIAFGDEPGRPGFLDSVRASAQHDGFNYPQPPSPPPCTVNPTFLDNTNFPNAPGMDSHPEQWSPPGAFERDIEAVQYSHDIDALTASRLNYNDGVEAAASSWSANIDPSDLQSFADQAFAHPSANPRRVNPENMPIDPAILETPWGQVSAQAARHPGLKPTSSDPEPSPQNPLLSSTSGNNNFGTSKYDYAQPDWTPEQAMADFKAYTTTYDSA